MANLHEGFGEGTLGICGNGMTFCGCCWNILLLVVFLQVTFAKYKTGRQLQVLLPRMHGVQRRGCEAGLCLALARGFGQGTSTATSKDGHDQHAVAWGAVLCCYSGHLMCRL